MTEEFAPEKNTSAEVAPEENTPEELAPEENITMGVIPKYDRASGKKERDIVCITITGPVKAVKKTIFTLYQLGFAEVDDWSPVQRTADPKQMISVLIRRQRAQEAEPPRPPQQKQSKQLDRDAGAIE
ncbi:MAG: hypothetical protein MUE44_19265 [Oscillatoriaceae cyanobacterium Prado104]|nr:hypothetical protein [Oscillatoriaceae cyanobacterium Prado104]